jgi:hypothetical protein
VPTSTATLADVTAIALKQNAFTSSSDHEGTDTFVFLLCCKLCAARFASRLPTTTTNSSTWSRPFRNAMTIAASPVNPMATCLHEHQIWVIWYNA